MAWDRTVDVGFPLPTDAEFQEMWGDRVTRNFYLLWRIGHIVPEGFAGMVLAIVKRIRERQPKTIEQLANCCPTMSEYWRQNDFDRFAIDSFPYICGTAEVPFRLKQPATT